MLESDTAFQVMPMRIRFLLRVKKIIFSRYDFYPAATADAFAAEVLSFVKEAEPTASSFVHFPEGW